MGTLGDSKDLLLLGDLSLDLFLDSFNLDYLIATLYLLFCSPFSSCNLASHFFVISSFLIRKTHTLSTFLLSSADAYFILSTLPSMRRILRWVMGMVALGLEKSMLGVMVESVR